MSEDEIREGVRKLSQSGKISPAAARVALRDPVEGEKLVLLEGLREQVGDLKRENDRQSLALFGDLHLDPPGVNNGVVKDVREMKVLLFTVKNYAILLAALFSLGCTLLGLYLLYIEATKR